MNSKVSASAAMFEKVLRAYETHGIPFPDVLSQLRRLLSVGVSPVDLGTVLRRRAWNDDQLPEYGQLQTLIDEAAQQQEAAQREEEDAPPTVVSLPTAPPRAAAVPDSEEEVTVDLDFDALNRESEVPERPRSSELDLSVLARRLRSIEERTPARQAALESLTRSYEKAKEAESAAAARATALAVDLAAARGALQAEKNRVLELERGLAERAAAAEAAREQSERQSERQEAELRRTRESLAEREAALEALRREIAERDARIQNLRDEQNKLERTLEARANLEARLQGELRDAKARAEARAAESKAAQDSAAAALEALRRELGKRDTRIESLQAEQTRLERALEARAGIEARLQGELRDAEARADAISAELRTSRETAKALDAQIRHSGANLDAAHRELAAIKEKSGTYLELLRTRAWRQGFDQNQGLATGAVVDAAQPPEPRAVWPAAEPPAEPSAEPPGEPLAEAPAEAPAAAWVAPPVGPLPAAHRKGRGAGGALAAAAAVVILIAVGWLLLHRSPSASRSASAQDSAPGSVFRDCPTCPAMTVLPSGRFKQGSSDGPASERPVHWVAVARPIAMSTSPVTLADFGQFITATGRDMQGCDIYDGEWRHDPGSSWEQPGFSQAGSHPVVCVSWNDAVAYAQWLSTLTGQHYRLPSASEWEYAARAGDQSERPWSEGGQDACTRANVADASAGRRYPGWTVFPCDDGYVYTAPAGAFARNSFGLNDMLGNVLQWTEDCWHPDYKRAPVNGSAWSEGDCSQHELRGASWFSPPNYARADYRDHFPGDYRTSSAGIRLVRDLPQ